MFKTVHKICRRHLRSFLLLVVLAGTQTSCLSHISESEIRFVPVDRLVNNLQKELHENPASDSETEFKIARLYSFAYAQNKTDLYIDEGATSDRPEEHVNFGSTEERWPPYRQFESHNSKKSSEASAALELAIKHYRKSLALAPQSDNARLGLAWCLEKNSETAEAMQLYRQIIENCENSPKDELSIDTHAFERKYECAFYLRHLLDPVKDLDEINRLGKLPMAYYGPTNRTHLVSPIVIPLKSKLAPRALMTNANIQFDLGTGLQHFSQWPSHDAGWLVYDKGQSGAIKSGYQLFGNHTFSLKWKNGFEALASLDDNHDGQIAGAELKNLAVWQDVNFDGKSTRSEIRTLSQLKVKSLAFSPTKKDGDMLRCEDGITFLNNETRTTYDVYLKATPTKK